MSFQNYFQLKFHSYILCLCMVYLFVMLIFHSDIQDSNVSPKQQFGVHEDVFPPMKMTLGPVDPTDPPRLRPTREAHSYHHHGFHDNGPIPHIDVEIRHVKILNSTSHDVPCFGPNHGKQFEFFELIRDKVYVYSAYWDDRPNDFDNLHNGSFVRIMAMMRWSVSRPDLVCKFHADNGSYALTKARFYEMCENHGRPFGGFILSCPVPHQIPTHPCSVEIGEDKSRVSYIMKVLPLRPKKDTKRFAICVPPLYGNVPQGKLVEFMELSKTLGAEGVTFYDFMVGDETAKVLEYYQQMGTVMVIPWLYPRTLSKLSWYHGQMLAIQDCLYRNMHISDYLAFNDIDEYFVPHKHKNWGHLVQAFSQPEHCAYCFSSAFFPPKKEKNGTMVFQSLRRTTYMSSIRTKCMVKPFQIFEKGIHHVSKPIWKTLQVQRMPQNVALLHHYRLCMRDFAMNCKDYVKDHSIQKYRHVVDEIKQVLLLL